MSKKPSNTLTDEEFLEETKARCQAYRQETKDKGFKDDTKVLVKDLVFTNHLEDTLKTAFKSFKIAAPRTKKPIKNTKRILNLAFSDTHYRAMLDSKEVNCQYGPVEEARRTAQVVLQTCEYKSQYRDETILNIHMLGDIIQNQLHDARDGQPLAEQCAAAISLLTQAVGYCAQSFGHVNVYCTPGNHGRNLARHQQRAVHEKWDSTETIIYYALKTACQTLANVSVVIPRTPYYICPVFNNKIFGTHGDTVLKVGYPGRTIRVEEFHKQINRINGSRSYGGPFKMFVCGHVHIGSLIALPGDTCLITNGCLCPNDSFSLSMGSQDTSSGQWLWESTPEHAWGDSRFIKVGNDTDKDKSLDKIIKPFTDF